MASDDKTYCGQGDRSDSDAATIVAMLMSEFGATRQDVLTAMDRIGTDKAALQAFFRDKQTFY